MRSFEDNSSTRECVLPGRWFGRRWPGSGNWIGSSAAKKMAEIGSALEFALAELGASPAQTLAASPQARGPNMPTQLTSIGAYQTPLVKHCVQAREHFLGVLQMRVGRVSEAAKALTDLASYSLVSGTLAEFLTSS
jgi:hypothetical protein